MRRTLALLGLILCSTPGITRAEIVIPTLDLDSLASMSKAVVAGEIIEVTRAENRVPTCRINVTRVLHGPVKVGDTLVVKDFYQVRRAPGIEGQPDSWEAVGTNDSVYLFLAADRSALPNTPEHAKGWELVSSGLRLVAAGNVYGFAQRFIGMSQDNVQGKAPHGLVAITPLTYPGAAAVSVEAFEKQVAAAFANVRRIQALVFAPADDAVREQIRRELDARERSAAEQQANSDQLSSLLIQRLIRISPSPEAVKLLRQRRDYATGYAVESALQDEPHRSYLLDAVIDDARPEKEREWLAQILSGAGSSYVRAFGNARDAQSPEANFLTRLAEAGVKSPDSRVGLWLLIGVERTAEDARRRDGAIAHDLRNAAEVLVREFPSASPVGRYRIASALMKTDPDRYRTLFPNAGPVLTLVTPGEYRWHPHTTRPAGRQLYLDADFVHTLKVPCTYTAVLRSVGDGTEVELPVVTDMGEKFDTFGGRWGVRVPLPDDVTGRRFVFLRATAPGLPASDGIGVEIDLPDR